MSLLRQELGTFIYRYEPCNIGSIRKMLVLLPAVHPSNLVPEDQSFYEEQIEKSNTIFKYAAADPTVKF